MYGKYYIRMKFDNSQKKKKIEKEKMTMFTVSIN